MKARVIHRHFVSSCVWKLFFDSKLSQIPSNGISLTFLVTLSSFTLFEPKTSASMWTKHGLKCAFLGRLFSDLSNKVET